MKNYIIKWDAGFGLEYDEIEAENKEEAKKHAYERCMEDVQSNINWGVIGEATDEMREDYL